MTAVGRTTAQFRCPCSDAETPPPPPAPRVVYIVEAEAPGGWPALLGGRCFRCGDRFCLLAGSTLPLGEYQVFYFSPQGVLPLREALCKVRAIWELEDCSPQGVEDFEELTQTIR